MPDWQPIETIPSDGRPYLVWMTTPLLGSHVQVLSGRTATYSGTIAGQFVFDLEPGIMAQTPRDDAVGCGASLADPRCSEALS